jgi:hypothetical protein
LGERLRYREGEIDEGYRRERKREEERERETKIEGGKVDEGRMREREREKGIRDVRRRKNATAMLDAKRGPRKEKGREE